MGRSIPKPANATALLPNLFGALLFGDLIGLVNARGCIFLHPRQDVAVEIERDPNLTVAEPLARHLRMYACGKHVGRVGMPKVVKSNARKMRGAGAPHR